MVGALGGIVFILLSTEDLTSWLIPGSSLAMGFRSQFEADRIVLPVASRDIFNLLTR